MKNYLLSFLATLLALSAFSGISAAELPYTSDFTEWTVIDLNGGTTWAASTSASDWTGTLDESTGKPYTKGMKYSYSSSLPADDWLISPAFHLEAGKTYEIVYWGKTSNNTSERYAVYITSSGNTVDDLNDPDNKIFDHTNLGTDFIKKQIFYVPETTGDYYLGYHCYSNRDGYWTYLTGFSIDEFVIHPGAVTELTIEAGENGAKTAKLDWTWPTLNDANETYEGTIEGAEIHRSQTANFKPSEETKIHTLTASGITAGGSGTWTDTSVPEAGTWYYRVLPYDENGTSKSTSMIVSDWIGYDIPKKVENVVATIDANDNKKVSLMFDMPAAVGEHNKPVNLDDVYFQIKRTGGLEVTLEEAWKGTLPYIDEDLPGYNSYQYQIFNVDADGELIGTTGNGLSNSVLGGGRFELPYYCDFSKAGDMEIFTLINTGTTYNRPWEWYQNSQIARVQHSSGGTNAWMITPQIHMVPGKAYRLKFDVSINYASTSYYGKMNVFLGRENTADGMSGGEMLIDLDPISWAVDQTKEIIFNVEEDGEYYIGFHDYTTSSNGYLYLDNIEIEELPVTPKAPTAFTATADYDGGRSIVLKWTNPTEAIDGSALTTIEKMEIYRSQSEGGEPTLLTTVSDNLVPGQESTYTDSSEFPEDGFYYYTLRPYLNDANREKAQVKSTWLGSDELSTVTNVVAVPSTTVADAIEVTFTLPRGKNGGWTDLTGVTYKITRRTGTGAETTVIENFDGQQFPYVDETLTELGKYTYRVYTVKDGTAATTGMDSNTVVGGGTTALPYSQTFDTAASLDLFMSYSNIDPSINQYPSLWGHNSGTARFFESSGQDDSYLVTPQFQLEPGTYKLTFDTYVQAAAYPVNLDVLWGPGTQPEDLTNSLYSGPIDWTSYQTTKTKVIPFEVDESGRYNIAFRAYGRFQGSTYLYLDNLQLERFDTAPELVENLTATVAENGVKTVTLTWTNPTKTNKDGDLTAISKIEIRRNDELIGTISSGDNLTVGGEASYEDANIELEPGTYTYSVVSYLDTYASKPTQVVSAWVGEDQPSTYVSNVEASISKENVNWIEVNFIHPKGVHNGWVNTANLTYKIERTKGIGSAAQTSTIEENWSGTLPYVDNSLEEMGKYTYKVYCNPNTTGISSNVIVGGGAKAVPYENAMNSNEAIDLFTITGNPTWSLDRTKEEMYVYFSTSNYTQSWLVSEPVLLQQGVPYEVSVEAYNTATSPSSNQNFGLYLGNCAVTDSLKNHEIYLERITNNTAEKKGVIINVPETGAYYIGIMAETKSGTTGYPNIYARNLKVTEGQLAPMPVDSIKATAADLGALSVTLKWQNPTLANSGNPLTSNISVKVFGEDSDTALQTLTDLVPGTESECTLTVDEAGIYNYTVVPYLGEEAGVGTDITTPWVGVDTPTPASNVSITMDEAGNRIITFEPATGAHGGYIDMSQVTYDIYRGEELIASGIPETTYTDIAVLEAGKYIYGVITKNGNLTSERVNTPEVVCGYLTLPYSPDYTSKASFDLWNLQIWQHKTSGSNVGSGVLSSENCAGTSANNAWAVTPPFKALKGSVLIDAYIDVENGTSNPKGLEVYLMTDQYNHDTGTLVKQYPERSITGPIEETIEVPIPDTGIYYIGFRALSDNNWYVYLKKTDMRQGQVSLPGIPAEIEDFTATAADLGALSATLTWTTPDKDATGEDFDGVTSVKIFRDNEELTTIDDVTPGEVTTYTDSSIETAGYYNYSVVAYAGDVEGLATDAPAIWVGPDVLGAPETVAASINIEGRPTVTYSAVERGAHGGYIDASAVTYNIYRDNTKIAEEVTDTTYVDMSELVTGNYTYGVSAVINGEESAVNNAMPLKVVPVAQLPYEQPFTAAADFNLWTLSNWSFKTKSGNRPFVNALSSGSTSASKDYETTWAVSLPFKADAGRINLATALSVEGANYPQDLEIYLMKTSDYTVPSTMVAEFKGLNNEASSLDMIRHENIEIEIPETGIYYIGYKVTSHTAWYTYVSEFILTQASQQGPAAPTNVTAEIEDDDSRTITYDAVTVDTQGNPVENVTYTIYRNDEVIATDVEGTSYSDTESGLPYASYVYGVQAVAGTPGEIGYADPIIFGEAITVDAVNPYEADFENDLDLWTFTPGDENDEESNWTLAENENGPHLLSTSEGAMAVSPAFDLNKKLVRFIVDVAGGVEDGNEHIYVYLMTEPGNAPRNLHSARRVNANGMLLADIVLEGKDVQTESKWFPVPEEGVYFLGFVSSPNASGEGVKLHSFKIEEQDIATGIDMAYTNGELIYNKASETILIPGPGYLEVYTTNGMKVVSVNTTDHVNIGELISNTYVARFVDAAGQVYTLKFVK